MANLLLTATNWKDGANASPPAEWNGSAYDFTSVDTLTLTATAAAGDTLAGTFAGTNNGQGHQVFINVNGSGVINWGHDLDSFPDSVSATLNAGDAVVILLETDRCGYAPDFTLTPPPAPPPVDACEEYGRVTRAYVSGYQLNRVHKSSLLCGATRCLALNFNGAISASRSIVSAEFKCNQPFAVVMSNPQITTDGRECHCTIYAQNQGPCVIQVNATLDNGDVYNQLFVVNVSRPAYFQNDPVPVTGPYVLTVSA